MLAAIAPLLPDREHRLGNCLAVEPVDRLLRLEGEEAQLGRQGKHVRREAQGEQRRGVLAPLRGERLRLVEPPLDGAQLVGEAGDEEGGKLHSSTLKEGAPRIK